MRPPTARPTPLLIAFSPKSAVSRLPPAESRRDGVAPYNLAHRHHARRRGAHRAVSSERLFLQRIDRRRFVLNRSHRRDRARPRGARFSAGVHRLRPPKTNRARPRHIRMGAVARRRRTGDLRPRPRDGGGSLLIRRGRRLPHPARALPSRPLLHAPDLSRPAGETLPPRPWPYWRRRPA